ncbi:hypothetical protein BDC45DRAFT_48683 [Circinella umbellata]|nr:hypothetical protein BDC45DRAFT_48683 [Circinella umbellata]
MSMINIPTNFQSLALLTAELPIEIGTLPMSDKFIPPVPLDPQFVNYLDTASVAKIASTVDTDSCRKDDVTIVQQDEEKNNLSPTTPEKVHMLKKMQRMLRLTSPSQIEAAKQLIPDNNEQDMPMTKNELFSLFEEAASLKSNNSDESSIRTGTTSAAGRHSSISTFVSSSSEQSSISQQKTMFPPPPTSPAPTVQQQRHQSANTPETKNLPALYRLSLGPELNTPILTSISNDKPQQIDQEPYSNNNSNANNNNNNNNTKLTTEVTKLIINKGQQNHHRRRINSDSIILDLKHNNNNNNDSSSPAPSSAIQQPQQHKRHELISSKSSGAIEGGVHYFYMFPESDSSSSSEEEQRRTKNKLKKKKRKSIRKKQEYCATTPAGFEKPNSVSGVNVNEAQVERLQIIRQNNNNAPSSSNTPYPVTHVDKPDELSNSEAEGLSSSHEEDLLDVLQRRDRKIASRMN